MSERSSRKKKLGETAILLASSAAAGAAGGIVGANITDPVLSKIAASTLGAVVSRTLTWAQGEFAHRALAAREQRRVRTVLELAKAEILERLDDGEAPRADGFFDPAGDERSAADEIAEGVLQVAQRTYEERKLPYTASLIASIVFSRYTPPISREHANHLIRLADQLSYRQLCLIALYKDPDRFQQRDHDFSGGGRIEPLAITRELFDLVSRGLINQDGGNPLVSYGLVPSKLRTTAEGWALFHDMRLDRIDVQELGRIAEDLRIGNVLQSVGAGQENRVTIQVV